MQSSSSSLEYVCASNTSDSVTLLLDIAQWNKSDTHKAGKGQNWCGTEKALHMGIWEERNYLLKFKTKAGDDI